MYGRNSYILCQKACYSIVEQCSKAGDINNKIKKVNKNCVGGGKEFGYLEHTTHFPSTS